MIEYFYMQIQFYNDDIEKFIESLQNHTIAKVLRTFDLLEKFGNELKMPHSKKVEKGLFELRIRGVQEVRFLYMFQKEKIVIVLSGFVKKTNKISQRQLNLAKNRKNQIDSL
jgi:phage-related protein